MRRRLLHTSIARLVVKNFRPSSKKSIHYRRGYYSLGQTNEESESVANHRIGFRLENEFFRKQSFGLSQTNPTSGCLPSIRTQETRKLNEDFSKFQPLGRDLDDFGCYLFLANDSSVPQRSRFLFFKLICHFKVREELAPPTREAYSASPSANNLLDDEWMVHVL